MSQPEQFEVLILGSGQGGKLLAWHLARAGRRTAVVERRWIGGPCPNIACLPSKNEIWSARVAHLAHRAAIMANLQYWRLRDAVLVHPTIAEGLGPLFSNVPPGSV
jgi:pyruvate/2-oxoglutarate dehydrogenase complex dihydrolipoamide dehydrogenase (E3) component